MCSGFWSFIFLLLNFEIIYSQNCSLITHEEVEELIPQFDPLLDGGEVVFTLLGYNISCLSLSQVQNHYRFTTISVTYSSSFVENEILTALVDIGCSSKNKWEISVLGMENTIMWSQPTPADRLRRDCAICISDKHYMGNTSDPITHCVACHSDCLDNDTLSGCSNELGTTCCLVYSEGLCGSQCADNESIGENYTCIPQTEHTEELLKISSSSNNEETFIISTTTYTSPSFFSSDVIISTLTMTPTQITMMTSHTPTQSNNDAFPDYIIHFGIVLSIVTSIITIILSVSFTLTILLCVCGLKRTSRNIQSPVDTISSIETTSEYVEPLSSPSNNMERSISMSETFSMQYNPSYNRVRYGHRVPHVQYEDPERVLEDIKNRRRSSRNTHTPTQEIDNGHNVHTYMTVLA